MPSNIKDKDYANMSMLLAKFRLQIILQENELMYYTISLGTKMSV